jgi:hypothetical protein
MSEEDKQEARKLAARAATQAKHSGQNAARAADTVIEPIVEEATETVKRQANRVSPRGLAAITGDMGVGFFALSVALYAGAIAYSRFDAAFKGRGRAIK